jgi:hypothetical protein
MRTAEARSHGPLSRFARELGGSVLGLAMSYLVSSPLVRSVTAGASTPEPVHNAARPRPAGARSSPEREPVAARA